MTTDTENFINLSVNYIKYFKSDRQVENKIEFLMSAFEIYIEVIKVADTAVEQVLLKSEILNMAKSVLYDKVSYLDEKYYEELISLLLKEDSKDTFAMVLAQAIDFVCDTKNSWRIAS